MAFEKWKFAYTPPPTLVTEPDQQATAVAPAGAGGGTIPRDGQRAITLLEKLQNFRDTAEWLENVVEPIAKNVVIPVDYKADPDLEQAFRRLFAVDTAPSVITYPMYQALVQTEDNIHRTEIELSNMRERGEATDRWGISEIQKMDVRRIIDAYEKGCVETGDFAPNFSVIYRELKGDQVILDSAMDALRIYTSVPPATDSRTAGGATVAVKTTPDQRNPYDVLTAGQGKQKPGDSGYGPNIVQPLGELQLPGTSSGSKGSTTPPETNTHPTSVVIPPGSITPTDIPPDFWEPLNKTFDTFGRRYGAVYDIARGIDCIYQDIANLIESFIANPLETIARVITTLKMLKASFHKMKLKDLRNALAVVILPVLISMAMRALSLVDGLVQKAIDPLRNRLAGIYKLMADVTRVGRNLTTAVPQSQACNRHDLTGIIKRAAIRGAFRQAASWADLSSLDELSKGLEVVRNTLNWAVEEPMRARHEAQKQLLKMIDKRTTVTGDRLEVLSNLRSVDALISVLNGIARELQLMHLPTNVLQANAIGQAAATYVTDNKVAEAAKPDVNRLISSIQTLPDTSITVKDKAVSSATADINPVSGTPFASGQEISVEKDPVPAPPDNVVATLLDLGSEQINAPESMTVSFYDFSELTK